MSYDLAVWDGKRSADDEAAADEFERLCTQYFESGPPQPPTERIRDYVAALVTRYGDLLATTSAPWSSGPLIDSASGPIVHLTISYNRAEEVSAAAALMAEERGLVCYDLQDGCLRPAASDVR